MATGTYYLVDGGEARFVGEPTSGYTKYTGGQPTGDTSRISSIVVESECLLPSNCRKMFYGCTRCGHVTGIENFNTSNVITTAYMFYNVGLYASESITLDLSSGDLSKVEDMESMFNGCYHLTAVTFPDNNTSSVTTMNKMFYDCETLSSISGKLETSSVLDMSEMFCYCKALTHVDFSSGDTSSVITMSKMFYNCNAGGGANLFNFNTSNVVDMSYMFFHGSDSTMVSIGGFTYKYLNLREGDVSNVSDMSYMFCTSENRQYDSKLEYIDIGDGEPNANTNATSIFGGNVNLSTIISKNGSSSITGGSMFYGCDALPGYYYRDVGIDKAVSTEEGGYLTVPTSYSPGTYYMTVDNTYYILSYPELNTAEYTGGVLTVPDVPSGGITDVQIVSNKYKCILPEACNNMFSRVASVLAATSTVIDTLDFSKFDTSNVTNMSSMFSGVSFKYIDLTSGDTSRVTTTANMFYNVSTSEINLQGLNFYEVTNMYGMFDQSNSSTISNLTSINLSNVTTNKVVNLGNLFAGCTALKTIDISSFSTSNVEDMSNMFSAVSLKGTESSLESIVYPSYFDTINVTTMSGMYDGCKNLVFGTSLDDIFTGNTTDMSYMFRGCSNDFNTIMFGNWDTSKVTTMKYTFSDIELEDLGGEIEALDVCNVENFYGTFSGCSNITEINLSNGDVSNAKIMSYMFSYDINLKNLNSIKDGDTSKVVNMDHMFSGCSILEIAPTFTGDTSNVADMSYMFDSCSSLTQLDLSNFDTHNVITVNGMFKDCSSLTSIDLSNGDTSNVEDMSYMFYKTGFKYLDLSNLNTASNKNFSYMFYGCENLNELNLKTGDVSSTEEIQYMFCNCYNLETIYAADGDYLDSTIEDDRNKSHMFNYCTKLPNYHSYYTSVTSAYDRYRYVGSHGYFYGDRTYKIVYNNKEVLRTEPIYINGSSALKIYKDRASYGVKES